MPNLETDKELKGYKHKFNTGRKVHIAFFTVYIHMCLYVSVFVLWEHTHTWA